MKKAWIMIALLAAGGLAGCGGSAAPDEAPAKKDSAAAPTTAPDGAPNAATKMAEDAKAAGAAKMGKASKTAESFAVAAPLFAENCVTCHGATGAGDGPMASAFKTKPRSFAADAWKLVDFSKSDAEVHAAIEGIIRNGIPAAMMPGYAKSMSAEEISAVTDYVLELRRIGREG